MRGRGFKLALLFNLRRGQESHRQDSIEADKGWQRRGRYQGAVQQQQDPIKRINCQSTMTRATSHSCTESTNTTTNTSFSEASGKAGKSRQNKMQENPDLREAHISLKHLTSHHWDSNTSSRWSGKMWDIKPDRGKRREAGWSWQRKLSSNFKVSRQDTMSSLQATCQQRPRAPLMISSAARVWANTLKGCISQISSTSLERTIRQEWAGQNTHQTKWLFFEFNNLKQIYLQKVYQYYYSFCL